MSEQTLAAMSNLAGVWVGAGHPVRLMAVLNVSPESFYSGSIRTDRKRLCQAAQNAIAEGADFIDLGGMSTAPYLQTSISEEEERERLGWALEALCGVVDVPISADTTRASVAAAAIATGARIINDVTGLRGDREMADVAAQAEGVVLVASGLDAPAPGDPLEVVHGRLAAAIDRAERAGIAAERMVIDPGIGFFPRAAVPAPVFNCTVIDGLGRLADLHRPILIGISRKSFIGNLTGRTDPNDRLAGSLGATAIAVYRGAAIVRTHDVRATRDVVRVAEAIRRAVASAGDP
jgi:dihydropteroate synthase